MRRTILWLLIALLAGIVAGAPTLHAQEDAPVDADTIYIVGAALAPQPAHQVVPKNTATGIVMALRSSDAEPGALPQLPADTIVRARLRGPSFAAAVELSGAPGELLLIPPLPLPGLYVVEDIRLESGGLVILRGDPASVSLEVIDRVLMSQVTTRPLSADEIRDRGIVFDESNYRAVDFTVAIGVKDQKIPIQFPVLLPKRPGLSGQRPPILPNLGGLNSQRPETFNILPPEIPLTNLGISGFSLECEGDGCTPEVARLMPTIPGVLIFPGRISYLNQYFSALLLVSNVAPDGSTLTVRDLQAEIVLPTGKDTVANSGDDPLRMARLGQPPVAQDRIQPVRQVGADGELGSADDLDFLDPGDDGNAEFLIEGRREGIHTVEIEIVGQLYGLPTGPVTVKGRAIGTLEVRDPQFTLTFNHPVTVNTGEDYDFHVTVTNISQTPANFARLSLLSRSISGAQLLSADTVEIDTILPGDSATATFRLRSLRSGSVVATSLASENTPGKFEFRMDVGELGIPLSPNTLEMPREIRYLPDDVRTAAVALLSQAYALATSPIIPPGLTPVARSLIFDRARLLAAAGQRRFLAEAEVALAWDLALDFGGNDSQRADSDADQIRSLDTLIRQSRRGAAFADALAAIFAGAVRQRGVLGFHADLTDATVSREPYFSVIVGNGTDGAAILWQVTDPDGKQLGCPLPATDGCAPVLRTLPFGQFYSLIDAAPRYSHLALVAAPKPGRYAIDLHAAARSGQPVDGRFELGVIVPVAGGLERLEYSGVVLNAGGRARLIVPVTGLARNEVFVDYLLYLDADGDGFYESQASPTTRSPVAEDGPDVISAVQMAALDGFGRAVAVLFDEEIAASTVLTSFVVAENVVLDTALQPDRRVVILALRDGVGPYIPRSVAVSAVTDRHGYAMTPISVTMPITMTVTNGAVIDGAVLQADHTPVPNALVELRQKIVVGERVQWETISFKNANADGSFHFDYVADFATALRGTDAETDQQNSVYTSIAYAGQRLDLDVILQGTGTLAGRVFGADGVTPLAGAQIGIESLSQPNRRFLVTSDEQGGFAVAGLPVGNLHLIAIHQATRSQVRSVINMPRNEAVVAVDLVLLPLAQLEQQTGAISGQVLRADGVTPAVNLPVFSNAGGLTYTDELGFFRLDNLPVGQLNLESLDAEQLESASVAVTVLAGREVTVNLLLVGGTGSVEGIVLNGAGQPVVGAQIGGGRRIVFTDAAGHFTLTDLPLSRISVQALVVDTQIQQSANVRLTAPGEVVTVILRLPAVGRIAGQITRANGVSVAGLDIYLIGPQIYTVQTDANGRYVVENVVAGSYQISAFLPNFQDGNVRSVRLAAHGQTVNGDVRFVGSGRLHIVVFNDDGVTPLAGQAGLSELKILTNQLKSSENPECLPDIKIGDQVIPMIPCRTIGTGFYNAINKRIVDNDPSSGEYLFENVLAGPVKVEAVNAFNGRAVAAGSVRAGATTYLTLTLQATSSLSGTVYQPDGITPVGADVVVTFNSRTMHDVRAVTDAQGHFSLPLVSAGNFSLVAEDTLTGLIGRSDGAVQAGDHAVIDVRLLGVGTLHVIALGRTGAPIPATLTLTEGNFTKRQMAGIADVNGRYTFNGVREGDVSVRAVDPVGGGIGRRSGVLPAPGAEITLTVTVPDEFGTVTGLFRNATGAPFPGAQVHLVSAFDGRDTFEITDASGVFTVTGVPKARFSISAVDYASGRTGTASGAVTAHGQVVTLTITAVSQGEVRGHVVESQSGQSVAGASVTLNSGAQTLVTSSGGDGSFHFPGVSAGAFRLSATHPTRGWIGRVVGVLQDENQIITQVITLSVPTRGNLEGRVLNADGSAALSAEVALALAGERYPRYTTANANGVFRFEDLPLVDFTVTATAQVGADAGQSFGALIANGETVSVTVQMIGVGRVAVQVVDSAGTPVPFARILLNRRSSTPRAFQAEGFANAAGAFTFASVLAGDFSLAARNPANGLGGAVSGAVTAAETVTLTVTLQPAATLRGRVLREDGQTPAAGMTVEVRGNNRTLYAVSADSGVFTFTDLPLATYQVNVSDPLGIGVASGVALLDAQDQVRDVGDLVLDESRPQVIALAPADGATNVPVTTTVTIRFSEPVLATSILCGNAATRLIVAEGATAVPGVCALEDGGATLRFTPSRPLKDFAAVSVRVKAGIADAAGHTLADDVTAVFITRDTTPPAIVSLSPAADAINVPLSAVIRVQYSEALDAAGFVGPAVRLFSGGVAVDGRVDLISGNTAVVFTPALPLRPNTVYSATLSPAVDGAGNRQAAGLTFTFSALDIVPPVVTSLALDGGGAVIVEGQSVRVTATVDDPVDVTMVDFFRDGVLVRSDSAAPFEYLFDAPVGGAPGLVLAARATDRAGNVSVDRQLALTVNRDQPPTVTLLSPAAGSSVEAGVPLVITVRSADDVGVARTFFQVGGALSYSAGGVLPAPILSQDQRYTLTVPADLPLNSQIQIQASAADTANQVSALLQATLTVTGTTVAFGAPLSGTLVIPGATVPVTISAADVDGVARVDLSAAGQAAFSQQQIVDPARATVDTVFALPIPANAVSGGVIILSARALDGKGNLSPLRTLILQVADVRPPQVSATLSTATAAAATTVVEGTTFSVTVTAVDDLALAHLGFGTGGVLSVGGIFGVTPVGPSTQRTFAVAAPLGVTGTVTATGVATDTAGNIGVSAPLTLTILPDQAPTVAFSAPADGLRVGPGTRVTVTVVLSDDVGMSDFTLTASGALSTTRSGSFAPLRRNHSEAFGFDVPVDGVNQTLIFTLAAVDGRGQRSAVVTRTLTIADVTAPTVAILSPANGTPVDPGSAITVNVRGVDDRGVTTLVLAVSGALTTEITQTFASVSPAQHDFTVNVPGNATGLQRLTFSARAFDAAANLGVSSAITLPVRDRFAPSVTLTVTPAAARMVQGAPLTLTVSATDEVGLAGLGYIASGALTAAEDRLVSPAQFGLRLPITVTPGAVLTVTGVATDTAGNRSLTAPFTTTIVAPGGPLTGVVRFANGTVASGAQVTVIATNGTFNVNADANGFYLVPTVLPGPVRVDAIAPNGQSGQVDALFGAYDLDLRVDVEVSGRPLVNLTFPTNGVTLVRGETITVTADARDDVGVAQVVFVVDGARRFTDTVAPYAFSFLVPVTASALTFSAEVTDSEANVAISPSVTTSLIDDPLTTVTGRVVDVNGAPVAGARITSTLGLVAVSGGDGVFTIPNHPTLASLRVTVTLPVTDTIWRGLSAWTVPVRAGTTNVGDVLVRGQVTWTGGAGDSDWQNPANWSDGRPPSEVDEVVIPAGGGRFDFNDDVHIFRLISGRALRLVGGVLDVQDTVQVNATFELSGGTLSHATVITGTGGQGLTVLTGGGLLDGVRLDVNTAVGTLEAANVGTVLTVRNGLILNGRMTLGKVGDSEWGRVDFVGTQIVDGTGVFYLTDYFSNNNQANGLRVVEAGTTLTLERGITVDGGEGFVGYSSQHGGTSDFTLLLRGRVTASRGGDMNVQVAYLLNDGGELAPTAAAIYVNGTTITNTNVLTLTGNQLLRFLNSGIVGGEVRSLTSSDITFQASGALNGVVLAGVDVGVGTLEAANAGTVLTVRNGLTFDGRMTLGKVGDSEWGRVDFVGTQRVDGVGVFYLTDYFSNNNQANGLRVVEAGTTLTLERGITVDGGEGFLGYSSQHGGTSDFTLLLRGRVTASRGGDMNVQVAHLLNDGGELAPTAAAIYVNGTTITNTNVLTLTGNQLLRFLNSGIVGGEVRSLTSSDITFQASGALDGVVLAGVDVAVGTLEAANAGTVLTVRNGLTFDGRMTLGKVGDSEWGRVDFVGTQRVDGTGTFYLTDYFSNNNQANGLRVVTAGTTLTLERGITVDGGEGFVGYSSQHGGTSDFTLLLRGRVTASRGGDMNVQAAYLLNDGGELAATAAAIYVNATTITNTNVLTLTGNQLLRFLNSGIVGGEVRSLTSSDITFQASGVLDGVVLAGVDVAVGTLEAANAGTVLTVRNGLTFDGRMTLGKVGDSEWGRVDFVGTQGVDGTGTFFMTNYFGTNAERNGLLVATAESVLTFGPNVTIQCVEGFVGRSTFHAGPQDFDLVNFGTIQSAVGGVTQVRARGLTNHGVIEQVGDMALTAALTNTGEIRPGTGAGTLALTGAYTQTASGLLTVLINGGAVGTGYSRLAVSGAATLDGALSIQRSPTYTPTQGTTFQVVSAAALIGQFTAVNGQQIDSGNQFAPSYTANGALLTVVPTVGTPVGGAGNVSLLLTPDAGSQLRGNLDNTTVILTFPEGAVTEAVTVTLSAGQMRSGQADQRILGALFTVDAQTVGGEIGVFALPFAVTVTSADLRNAETTAANLHYWSPAAAQWISLPTAFDATNASLSASADRPATFAVLARVDWPLFLPWLSADAASPAAVEAENSIFVPVITSQP